MAFTPGESEAAAGAVALSSAALALLAIGSIVRRLVAHPRIDAATTLGVVCTYLLIGTFFAFVYAAVGSFGDQAFFVTQTDPTSVDFLYFSFVTMTTVGYGDFTAATNLGRMLAVTQALLGQLYLVTVVALVIGNVGRERRAPLASRGARAVNWKSGLLASSRACSLAAYSVRPELIGEPSCFSQPDEGVDGGLDRGMDAPLRLEALPSRRSTGGGEYTLRECGEPYFRPGGLQSVGPLGEHRGGRRVGIRDPRPIDQQHPRRGIGVAHLKGDAVDDPLGVPEVQGRFDAHDHQAGDPLVIRVDSRVPEYGGPRFPSKRDDRWVVHLPEQRQERDHDPDKDPLERAEDQHGGDGHEDEHPLLHAHTTDRSRLVPRQQTGCRDQDDPSKRRLGDVSDEWRQGDQDERYGACGRELRQLGARSRLIVHGRLREPAARGEGAEEPAARVRHSQGDQFPVRVQGRIVGAPERPGARDRFDEGDQGDTGGGGEE